MSETILELKARRREKYAAAGIVMRDFDDAWAAIMQTDTERRALAMKDPRSVGAHQAVNATVETLRHKRESVIDSMFARGKLMSEQRRAANEICAVWIAITGSLFARVQEYEPRIKGGAPAEDWRAGLISAYSERYIPWRQEAGAVRVGRGRTAAELVLAVAVDNFGFRQVADMYRMDQRTVLTKVRESLFRYAQIGGWIDATGRATCA